MNQSQEQTSQKALEIAGAIDGSNPGAQGRITVDGGFAEAIMRQVFPCPTGYDKMGIHGQPVTIHRGSRLELDCDGFKLEGSEIRVFVHNAVDALLESGASA